MSEEKSIAYKWGFLTGTIRSIEHYLNSTVMTDEQKLNSIRGHIQYTYEEGAMDE